MTISEIAYPRQVILVSCRGEIKSKFSPDLETKDNIVTLSWHTPVSFNPELYGIVLAKQRYSYNLIKQSKVFVVNFMPFKLKKEVLFCGRNHGEHMDKFKETGLKKQESETIDCPRIKQATGCLECELVNEIEAGDHVILIGKVLKSIKNKQDKKTFQKQSKSDVFTTTV